MSTVIRYTTGRSSTLGPLFVCYCQPENSTINQLGRFSREEMKLWPHDSFILQSSAPVSELIEVLRTYTETPHQFYWPKQRRDFKGTIGPNGFRISLTRSRIHFTPIVVRGKFEQRPNGTTIDVWMSYPPYITYIISFMIACFFLILALIAAYAFISVNGIYIAIPFLVSIPLIQGIGLWIILLAVFWEDAHHIRHLLEWLVLQPAVALQASTRRNASEIHRRNAVVEYITAIAFLCFGVGFIVRWFQHGLPNAWIDAVVATAGTMYILLLLGGRLYAAFPLKSEIGNPVVRKWTAMPAVILITLLVSLALMFLIGQWASLLVGISKP